jgi:putative colanic acid biosynthesis glycosyltransferase WcaI
MHRKAFTSQGFHLVKILLLTQFYPPEANSAALKMADLAGHLTARGHQVTVVTGFPNYPDGVLHEGYRRTLCQSRVVDGTRVIRTFVTLSPKRRQFSPRMKSYLSFMASSIYGAMRAGRQDLVYVYSPPLTLGVSGYVISRMLGAALVFDVNDLWPRAPIQLGLLKNPILIRMAEDLERFVYAKSDRVFFYSSWMREEVVRAGTPESKTEVHPFWIDTDVFQPVSEESAAEVRRRFGIDDRLVVMYTGNLGLPQGLDTAIDCAKLLKERNHRRIQFVFVGGGADKERLVRMSEGYGLDNVLFVPPQPVSAMPAFMSAADVLLLHLDKAPFRAGTVPGKLLAYLSCGRSVLVGLEGEGADLIRQAGCGVVVEPENAEAMAQGLDRLADPDVRRQMGGAARQLALDRFDRKKLLASVESRFEEIVASRRRLPAPPKAS